MEAERWRDRPVLVTGGAGFAGGWLVRRLLELGATVVCIVRDWDARSSLLREETRAILVFGDVRDQALVERTLGDHEVDVVFHLAAQAAVPVANRNPVETFDSNLRGTWSLVEACRRSPTVSAVVVASSDKAYGEHDELPYRESTPLDPRNPYDVSKAGADLIARSYATTFGLPLAVTRAGNLFGGGDLTWSRVVPGTIRSVLRGTPPVIRSDGTPLRDYVYVEDAVAAYVLAAEAVLDGELAGEALNISYGRPLAVREVVSAVLAEIGSDLEPTVEGTASGEIQDQYLDATAARERLGWSPRWTFESALAPTVDWYRRHLASEAEAP